jgi:hypothetical protein
MTSMVKLPASLASVRMNEADNWSAIDSSPLIATTTPEAKGDESKSQSGVGRLNLLACGV